MSNDIYSILKRFDSIVEGQDAAQKSVHQLPALFKPKNISPVLGSKKDPANPLKGYFVGGESKEPDEEVDEAEQVTFEPARATTQVIKQGNKVLGTVNNPQLAANIKAAISKGEMTLTGPLTKIPETSTTEDVVSTVKKKLGDYLQDVASAIKADPDLVDKIPKDADHIGPAVKTITTDDGHEIKIHGNEDDGFRITVKNQPHSARFKNLDEASMAVEMFCNRRRQQDQNQDYIEERS
jgi:hypothetical protein